MKVLKIESKDIYITFEISWENLKNLFLAICMAEIDYNGQDIEEKKAIEYLENEFVPAIKDTIKQIEG